MKLSISASMVVLESGAWLNISVLPSIIEMFNRPFSTQTQHFRIAREREPLEVRTVVISQGRITFDYRPAGQEDHSIDDFRIALLELNKEFAAAPPRTDADNQDRPRGGCCAGNWKPKKPELFKSP